MALAKTKVVSGDFTGDGKTDIAHVYDWGDSQWVIWVWRSTSGGTDLTVMYDWGDSWVVDIPVDRHARQPELHPRRHTLVAKPTGWSDWENGQIVAGDYNGDGRYDVATLWDLGGCAVALYVHTSTGAAFGQGQTALRVGAGHRHSSELLLALLQGHPGSLN